MRGDARVLEYLNRGLRHELAAINQYWLHYRLLDNWGYRDLAKKWREESMEEMSHADKLIARIIFLDGMPNLQVLDPLRIGQTVILSGGGPFTRAMFERKVLGEDYWAKQAALKPALFPSQAPMVDALIRGEIGVVRSTWFAPSIAYEVEFHQPGLGHATRALLLAEQVQVEEGSLFMPTTSDTEESAHAHAHS